MCGAGAAAPIEQDTAAWCVRAVLAGYGVTTDYATIRSQMGAGFAPVLIERMGCYHDAWRSATVALLQPACAAYGFSARALSTPATSQRSVLMRRQVRVLLQQLWEDRQPVLLWLPRDEQGREETWGVLREVTDEGVLRVQTPGGTRYAVETPNLCVVMEMTNACPTPTEQQQQAVLAAIRLLRGHATLQAYNPPLRSGVAALDFVANAAHSTPWCPICGDDSMACVSATLAAWAKDLEAGLATLKAWRGQASLDAAPLAAAIKDLSSAQMQLGELALMCATMATTVVAQSVCGEALREVNLMLWQAANNLARASDAAVLPFPDYASPLPPLRVDMLTLADWLPLYGAMDDGADSLLCSTLIALRLAGVAEAPEILRGPYVGFARLELDPATCAVHGEAIERDPHFAACLHAAGMTPRFMAVAAQDPLPAQDFVRQAILASLITGMPVLARGLGDTPAWGVVIGATNFGRALLCRTADDTTLAYRVSTRLPAECVLLTAARKPSDREVALGLLRAGVAVFTNQPKGTTLSGAAAWRHWLATVRKYVGARALPTRVFAQANGTTWVWLRDNRRASYKYLGLLARRVPELAHYFTTMQRLQVQQATVLTHTQADGCVLTLENEQWQPPDWFGALAGQQYTAMSNCFVLEERVVATACAAIAWYDQLYMARRQPRTAPPTTEELVRRARAAANAIRAAAATAEVATATRPLSTGMTNTAEAIVDAACEQRAAEAAAHARAIAVAEEQARARARRRAMRAMLDALIIQSNAAARPTPP
jgi:hypothetical protein